MEVFFHKEGVSLNLDFNKLEKWIKKALKHFKYKKAELGVIFCDDNYLKKINVKYLNHDFFTDVISFDYSENKIIKGDVFVSVDRVKENASRFGVSFNDELFRVIIHGVLHLCGFNDKTVEEKKEMRKQENFFLNNKPL